MTTTELEKTLEQLEIWKSRIAKAQEIERGLRKALIDAHFKKLTEGSNTAKTDIDGLEVKLTATQPVKRTVDPESINAAYQKVETEYGKEVAKNWFAGIFVYKPSLNLTNYRTLEKAEDEQTIAIRKIIDTTITAKEGLPSLKVVVEKD